MLSKDKFQKICMISTLPHTKGDVEMKNSLINGKLISVLLRYLFSQKLVYGFSIIPIKFPEVFHCCWN